MHLGGAAVSVYHNSCVSMIAPALYPPPVSPLSPFANVFSSQLQYICAAAAVATRRGDQPTASGPSTTPMGAVSLLPARASAIVRKWSSPGRSHMDQARHTGVPNSLRYQCVAIPECASWPASLVSTRAITPLYTPSPPPLRAARPGRDLCVRGHHPSAPSTTPRSSTRRKATAESTWRSVSASRSSEIETRLQGSST